MKSLPSFLAILQNSQAIQREKRARSRFPFRGDRAGIPRARREYRGGDETKTELAAPATFRSVCAAPHLPERAHTRAHTHAHTHTHARVPQRAPGRLASAATLGLSREPGSRGAGTRRRDGLCKSPHSTQQITEPWMRCRGRSSVGERGRSLQLPLHLSFPPSLSSALSLPLSLLLSLHLTLPPSLSPAFSPPLSLLSRLLSLPLSPPSLPPSLSSGLQQCSELAAQRSSSRLGTEWGEQKSRKSKETPPPPSYLSPPNFSPFSPSVHLSLSSLLSIPPPSLSLSLDAVGFAVCLSTVAPAVWGRCGSYRQ